MTDGAQIAILVWLFIMSVSLLFLFFVKAETVQTFLDWFFELVPAFFGVIFMIAFAFYLLKFMGL